MVNVTCVYCDGHCVAMYYMDDLFVLAESQKRIENVKVLLGRDLNLKDPRKARLLLGIEISWEPNSVKLSRKKLIKRLLEEHGVA